VTSAANGGGLAGSNVENLPLSIDGPQVWLQVGSGNGVFETSAGTTATPNTGSGWVSAGSVTDPSAWNALASHSYSVAFTQDPSTGALSYSVTDDATGSAMADANGNTSFAYQPGKAITVVPGISFAVSGTPDASSDSFHVGESTPDLNVFKALDRAVAALSNPNANNGQVMQAVNAGISDMDQVLGSFQSARAMVGETLNRLDGVESRTGGRILAAQTTRSNVEDVDMVQAISEFTNRQTSYQAALQSYSMVQKLSLFNYISG
jgi:flagellar hook-associated protein 3 FlgL